jgi:hypothetical protein
MQKIILICSLFIFLNSYLAYGAEYKLVKGSQFKMCKMYGENLNSFAEDGPMVCEVSINQKIKDLSMPEWTLVNSSKYNNILLILKRAFEDKGLSFYWPSYPIEIYSAKFDIGHDGKNETVLKLVKKDCSAKHQGRHVMPISSFLYILAKDSEKLNPDYSRLVGERSEDVILYQNRAFLTNWSGAVMPEIEKNNRLVGYIYVYETFMVRGKFGMGNKPICKYEYLH